MSAYGHGPTAREQQVIDLKEQGLEVSDIAQALNLSERYVRQVLQALFAPKVGGWQKAAQSGSANLLAALRRHHPDRCARGAWS